MINFVLVMSSIPRMFVIEQKSSKFTICMPPGHFKIIYGINVSSKITYRYTPADP